MQQSLWVNSNFRVNDKPVINKGAESHGIKYVSDVFNLDGSFKSYMQVRNNSGNYINYMDCYVTCESISAEFRRILRCNEPHGAGIVGKINSILTEYHVSRYVHNELLDNMFSVTKRRHKWEDVLGINMSDQEMLNEFSRILQITNHSKLRSFQFCILHYAIITNRRLFLYKIRDNQLCYYCHIGIEKIAHLFWECPVVRDFYLQLTNLCKEIIPFVRLTSLPTAEQIILMKFNQILSVLANYHVYKTRCLKEALSIDRFKAEILTRRKMERYYRVMSDTLDT